MHYSEYIEGEIALLKHHLRLLDEVTRFSKDDLTAIAYAKIAVPQRIDSLYKRLESYQRIVRFVKKASIAVVFITLATLSVSSLLVNSILVVSTIIIYATTERLPLNILRSVVLFFVLAFLFAANKFLPGVQSMIHTYGDLASIFSATVMCIMTLTNLDRM